MPDFRRVDHPLLSPTTCRFCGDFAGPMLDTLTDDPIGGRIYICAPTESRPGCVGAIATLFGFVALAKITQLKQQVEELQGQLDDLVGKRGLSLSWSEFNDLRRLSPTSVVGGVDVFFDSDVR